MIDLTEPLQAREIADATVYPTLRLPDVKNRLLGGVFADGKHVERTQLERRSGETGWPARPEMFGEPDPVEFEEAIYGGILYFHFGHFLVESLARTWLTPQHPDVPIVWAGAANWHASGPHKAGRIAHPGVPSDWQGHAVLHPWQQELLSVLDIRNPGVILTQPTRIKKLHVPDIGYRYDDQFHPEHAAFLAHYEGPAQDPDERLWLSRSALPSGVRDLNEHVTERRLAAAGWTIAHPEQLSVREQLDLISRASVVSGDEGSAFHLIMLLANASDKRLEVVRRRGHEHRNMHTIGDAVGVSQRFHTLEGTQVLSAQGRWVTKVSSSPAGALKVLNVPLAPAPEQTDDASLALAHRLASQIAGDGAILEVGVADPRALSKVSGKRKAVVCEQLAVDPRSNVVAGLEIYEMSSRLFAATVAEPDAFDVVILGSTHADDLWEDFCASLGAARSGAVWLVPATADETSPDAAAALARIVAAFPGLDASTVAEDEASASLVWFQPRGLPVERPADSAVPSQSADMPANLSGALAIRATADEAVKAVAERIAQGAIRALPLELGSPPDAPTARASDDGRGQTDSPTDATTDATTGTATDATVVPPVDRPRSAPQHPKRQPAAPEVILHFGLHKTGTTAIQETLRRAQRKGTLQGVFYLNAKPSNHSYVMAPAFGSRKNIDYYTRVKFGGRIPLGAMTQDEARSLLVNSLEEARHRRVPLIVSSEDMSMLTSREVRAMRNFLKAYGVPRVRCVVYVRPIEAWSNSYAAQLVKQGLRTVSEVLDDPPYPIFRDYIGKYVEVFGAENVTIRPFDRAELVNGSVVADLLHVVAPDHEQALEELRANESPNLDQLRLVSRLTELIRRGKFRGDVKRMQSGLGNFRAGKNAKAFALPRETLDRARALGSDDAEWLVANSSIDRAFLDSRGKSVSREELLAPVTDVDLAEYIAKMS
ncbi:glycosyltransferase family 61 protein [Demequina salsinemoris]|uniref:glycosyltransferase family 61 protein n=1 Tax=Demequina salsinemoris TaxID=577470 RepID=UPI0007804FFA|nr:glycosyltransferase 61 family protein [Demequina salsinemoris]